MSRDELHGELAAGVTFWGYDDGARLVGVMGLQHVRDVDLIRHAYVLPKKQGCDIGSELLRHLRAMNTRPMLVGTWAAAIRFYERHGFALVSPARKTVLLKSTGASRSARSRRRSCWPIRRKWLRAPSPRLRGEGRDEGRRGSVQLAGRSLTRSLCSRPPDQVRGQVLSPRAGRGDDAASQRALPIMR